MGRASSVLDRRCPVAVITAATKFRVERIKQLNIDASERDAAEQRTDVRADLRFISSTSRWIRLQDDEIPVDELIDSSPAARVALLVHLVEQPRARLLREPPLAGTRWDGFAQVQAALRHWVPPGKDLHPEGTGGELFHLGPAACF
jgi:hypothetical protein